MTLHLRQRWQRRILRACLPVLAERDALLIDARSSACRVAVRGVGSGRWLCIELVENRGQLMACVKVALSADELLPSYVSHGTSGEPLVKEVIATLDASRAFTWHGSLDDLQFAQAMSASLDAYWSEWCRRCGARGEEGAREALALARDHGEVFLEVRRRGGILPDMPSAEWTRFDRAMPYVALGGDATQLGATEEQAFHLAASERRIRQAHPSRPWPDATPLLRAASDG